MTNTTNKPHPTIPQETSMQLAPLSVRRIEWEHIQRVLGDYNGNISAAARALGIDRRTLQRKLRKQSAGS